MLGTSQFGVLALVPEASSNSSDKKIAVDRGLLWIGQCFFIGSAKFEIAYSFTSFLIRIDLQKGVDRLMGHHAVRLEL